jgi:hypothetical protein
MKLKDNITLFNSIIFILLINYFPILKGGVDYLYAQKVRVTVELQLDALPDEKREKLINFKQVLEDYFNNFQWTQGEFQGELLISLKMMLQDISVNYEDRYKTQFIISSTDIQYTDKRCRMAYQKGEIPNHSDNNWDSLTSLLDFFTNIIIGEEMDKYGNLLGAPYYEKAKVIAEQAKFGMGHFIDGWDLRVEMIDYLLADKYKQFREMKDFYFYGLYFANEDPTKAKKYIKEAVSILQEIKNEEDPKYARVEKFINAHYMEIVELFKNSNDRDVYDKLMILDPDREEIYQDVL